MEKKSSTNLYKVAGITALILIAFFMIMKFLNLVTIVELRFVNFFFLLLAVRYMLLAKRAESDGKLEYLSGMVTGFMTALMSSLFFAIFIFLYLSYIDTGLMQFIIETQPFGNYLSPGAAAIIIILEGVASGAILSFAMMHLFNRDNNPG